MKQFLVFLGWLLVAGSGAVMAQESVSSAPEIPSPRLVEEIYEGLFEDQEPLDMTLTFDIREFQRTRSKGDYKPAEMTVMTADSLSLTHAVRVKARGIFRRSYCNMPPYWLNIRYSGIGTDNLEGIKRMKMVTRCSGSGQHEPYVLREYLVYRIYNKISPHSFNVRLVRLKYVDTGRKNKESIDWAFLIEPEQMMANRLGAGVVKNDKLAMRSVNPLEMERLAMFQYMIGNGDYSVTGRHNLKILKTDSPGRMGYVPVPYDFDYTGLVNTEYAVPGENLGISSVRERYFLGPCRSPGIYSEVIEDFRSMKEEILELILGFEYLEEDERKDMVAYINGFFKETESERFIDRKVTCTCR